MNSSKKKPEPAIFRPEQFKPIRIFLSYRYKIQEVLNKYEYKEELSHPQNIQKLCAPLSNLIQLSPDLKEKFIASFKQFLSNSQNIPIEINFKKLKYEQLCSLFDQWQISHKQPSLLRSTERLYSIQHRNILFNRVFVEQRQNIQIYFQTLSEKKMLKGVDIYQLLVDILSRYYLYEFSTDNQTFFQKVNSFNNFLEVVQKFIHNERRIIIDNKSKDFQYIKLYEFQALIYFWESVNVQLELRSDRRFSNRSQEVQTEELFINQTNQAQCQTQKQKQKQLTLHETINLTLKSLNKLTEEEVQPQKLQIIQNLCESLRKQKIQLVQFQKSKIQQQKFQKSKLQQQKMLSGKRNQSSLRSHANQASSLPFSLHNDFQEIRQERQSRIEKQPQMELQKTQRKSMRDSPKIDEYRNSNLKNQENQMKPNQAGNQRMQQSQIFINKRSEPNKESVQGKKLRIEQLYDQKNMTKGPSTSKISEHHSSNQNKSLTKINSHQQIQSNYRQIDYSVDYLHRTQTENSQLNPSLLKLFQGIFAHYYTKNTGFIDLQKLNDFFVDLGVIEPHQTKFTFDLIKQKVIKNTRKIGIVEFLQIMGHIMKQDEDLTYEVIYQFFQIYIVNARPNNIQPRLQKLSYQQATKKALYEDSRTMLTHVREGKQHSSGRKRYKYTEQTPEYKYCEQTPKFTKTSQMASIIKSSYPTQKISERYSPSKKVSIPFLYLPKTQKQKSYKY